VIGLRVGVVGQQQLLLGRDGAGSARDLLNASGRDRDDNSRWKVQNVRGTLD